MSLEALRWVGDHSEADSSARHVLLELALHANRDTGQCNPGLRRLADRTALTIKTVRAAIRRLEELGELEVKRGHGRTPSEYRLTLIARGATTNECGNESRANGEVSRDLEAVARDLTARSVVTDVQQRATTSRRKVEGLERPSTERRAAGPQEAGRRPREDAYVEPHIATDEERARARAGPIARARLAITNPAELEEEPF